MDKKTAQKLVVVMAGVAHAGSAPTMGSVPVLLAAWSSGSAP